jgi:metal-responsive CopG/Arc/MetJ family transcriptional regulator
MNSLKVMQRKTQRVTVSMPQGVVEELLAIADEDGRSLSNLVAFLVESRLEQRKKDK